MFWLLLGIQLIFFVIFITKWIIIMLYKKDGHSTSLNIHAIRNGKRCNVRLCGISH